MNLIQFIFSSVYSSSLIAYLIIIFLLLLFSALISGSEVAFFSLGPAEKDQLKNENSKIAQLTLELLEKPQELLAIILVVNNFLNVGIVIFSSALLTQLFHQTGISTFHFVIEILFITLMILLIGEVIPKVYATKRGLFLAKFMARPIYTLRSIPPFSWLKSFLVNGTRIIQKYAKRRGVSISSDELEQAIMLTKEETTSEEEQKILEGIVKFGNTDVKQIMHSRMEVVSIDISTEFQQVLVEVVEAGYSRIPIIENSFDRIIGILYVKDLLPHLNDTSDFEWRNLIRKPFFVPENKKIDDLLKDFQAKKMHMAIVVDEYGGGSGIVTLEDVLEEIVGDITEEFDDEIVGFKQLSPSVFIFEGRTALVDMYKALEIDGKDFEANKGESDSIGGFIIEQVGRILKNNEYFRFNGYKLIVLSSDKRRIKSVKVIIESNN